MSLARARRGRFQANHGPGFVDMLSTLLLVVTFLMALFMLANFVVTQADERQGHDADEAQPPARRADRAARARTLQEGVRRGQPGGAAGDA